MHGTDALKVTWAPLHKAKMLIFGKINPLKCLAPWYYGLLSFSC